MALLRRAVALAALASAENLKTVYVATLPELVEAMEEPEVGRIFLNDSITLAGSPLPTIDGRLLEIEAGPACAAPCALSGAGGRIFNVGGRPGGLSLAGLALRDAASSGNGSAIYVAHGVASGGGLLSVNTCAFENNTALGDGGAVYAGRHAILAFEGCAFRDNLARGSGGAVAGYGLELGVSATTFVHNSAVGGGGALFLEGGNASLSLSASRLERNDAGSGGAVGLGRGDAARAGHLGAATAGVHGVVFANNSARGAGGALRAGPLGNFALNDCRFLDNSALGRGGAVAVDAPNPTALTNSSFIGNVVFDGGGAALAFGSDPTGAAPPALAASVVHNVTFEGNALADGASHGGRGAGILINEGTLIFAMSAFSANVDAGGAEDDVCAYGAGTAALFKPEEKPAACGACAGRGTCA